MVLFSHPMIFPCLGDTRVIWEIYIEKHFFYKNKFIAFYGTSIDLFVISSQWERWENSVFGNSLNKRRNYSTVVFIAGNLLSLKIFDFRKRKKNHLVQDLGFREGRLPAEPHICLVVQFNRMPRTLDFARSLSNLSKTRRRCVPICSDSVSILKCKPIKSFWRNSNDGFV